MPIEQIKTLIIGGGQAGLTMSHRLKQRGLAHLVLERGRIGERWRSERWDGLRFQFPNWSVRLPDFLFPHTDPDGFATSGEIVDFIAAYAGFVAAPIRCGVAMAYPALSPKRPTARSSLTMSSSLPVPTSAPSFRPYCAITSMSFRSTPADT
jgi:cation diffusion facilitator CzcD-associated flavoprotein CzcO